MSTNNQQKIEEKSPLADEILDSIKQIIAEDEEDIEYDSSELELIEDSDETMNKVAINTEQTQHDETIIDDDSEVLELDDSLMIEFETGAAEDLSEAVENSLDHKLEQVEKSVSQKLESSKSVEQEQQMENMEHNANASEDIMDDFIDPDFMNPIVPEQPLVMRDITPQEQEEIAPNPAPETANPPIGNSKGLLSESIANKVSQTFAELNQEATSNDVSLNNFVRELMRPMVQQWLEENLPTIVEKEVRAEVRRISNNS